MRFGPKDKFWAVTDPTPHSELLDILFESSLADLLLQFKGGLRIEDNPTIFTDREEAEAEARARLHASPVRAAFQDGAGKEGPVSIPRLISREDAIRKLARLWAGQRARLDDRFKGRLGEPRWERARNYELANDLHAEFGREWIISEWCPFNGVYCRWVEHAPENALLKAIDAINDSHHEGAHAAVAYLRDELAKRKKENQGGQRDA